MKSGRVSLYILIVLSVAVIVWLFVVLSPGANVETPPVLLPTDPPVPSDELSGESGEGESGNLISVTPDTVQAAISSLTRADSYHRILTAETRWSGGSSLRETEVFAKGDKLRLIIKENNETKNVLISEGQLYIWYSDSESVYQSAAKDGDYDAYQAILTYEDILEIDKKLITDAGYTEFADENCIYAQYLDEDLGYTNRFYVSVETGLVMGDDCYDGENLIYSLRSSLPEILTPEDEVFSIPD